MILSKSEIEAKIVFVGNSGVGKTNIIKQLCDNCFDNKSACTVAVDIMKLKITGPKN